MWEIKNREQGEVGERSSIEPQRVTISLSGKRLRNPRRKKNTGFVSEKVGPMWGVAMPPSVTDHSGSRTAASRDNMTSGSFFKVSECNSSSSRGGKWHSGEKIGGGQGMLQLLNSTLLSRMTAQKALNWWKPKHLNLSYSLVPWRGGIDFKGM